MSFQAGSITSAIGLDNSPWTQSMLQVESVARLFPNIVQNFLASPILGFVGVLQTSGSALKSWFTDITNATDNLNDQASAIGVDVQLLSAYGLAAENAGG